MAVVYQRSQHFINLFVWPSSSGPAPDGEGELTRQGYNLIHWSKLGHELLAYIGIKTSQS